MEQNRDRAARNEQVSVAICSSRSFNKIGVTIMPDTETKDLKAAVLELVDDLPSDATWEDVMYRVYVREAIEAGRKDAAEGRLVDLAEVRRRFGLPE
jgi:hypothetical protein